MGKSRLVGKFQKEKKWKRVGAGKKIRFQEKRHQKSGKNDICVIGNGHVEEKACSPSSLRHIVRAWIFLLLVITIIVRCQVVVTIITIITSLGKIDLGARKNVVGWPSILDTLFDSHLFLWTHESKHVREFGFLYSRYCITHQVVLKKKTQHQTFGGNSIAFLSVWFVAPVYCRHGFVRLERICKLEQYVMHNCLQVCSDCFRTLISQPLPFFLCFHNNRS